MGSSCQVFVSNVMALGFWTGNFTAHEHLKAATQHTAVLGNHWRMCVYGKTINVPFENDQPRGHGIWQDYAYITLIN